MRPRQYVSRTKWSFLREGFSARCLAILRFRPSKDGGPGTFFIKLTSLEKVISKFLICESNLGSARTMIGHAWRDAAPTANYGVQSRMSESPPKEMSIAGGANGTT